MQNIRSCLFFNTIQPVTSMKVLCKQKRKASKHQMAACCNCKRTRKKCDAHYPICSNCERIGAQCTTIYAPTGREIKRDYINTLEDEIKNLNIFLQKIDDKDTNNTSPRYIGETSAYSIAKAISNSITSNHIAPTTDVNYGYIKTVGHHHVSKKTFVKATSSVVHTSRSIGKKYLDAYHKTVQCQYPFLDWKQVQWWFDQVMGKWDRKSVNGKMVEDGHLGVPGCPEPGTWEPNFFIHMIFAIANQLRPAELSDVSVTRAYYEKAFESVGPLVETISIHTVQAYLLMAIFSQKMPDGASIWQTTGLAIRTSVALGLHRKPYRWKKNSSAGSVDKAKSRAEDLRARVFWSAYGIERINGIVLGRPFSISDVDIDAPLPQDTKETEIACHIIRLRRIQSNICTFIYNDLLESSEDIETTREQIMLELNDWMNTYPSKADAASTFETNNWSIISYHNATQLLLRPVILEVVEKRKDSQYIEWFKVFTESSSSVCFNYKYMYLKHKLDYTWSALNCCFMSGISFLYCLWIDCSLHVLKWKHERVIYDTIQACSTILYVFSEHWNQASVYRDSFEFLSGKVKQCLGSNKVEGVNQFLKNGIFLDGNADYIKELPFHEHSDYSKEYLNKLWKFLDGVGDKYVREIFKDMERRMCI